MNKDILYVNSLTNVCYNASEILELNIRRGGDETVPELIFNLYAKILTKCNEQKLVLYHLTYDKVAYTVAKLIKVLSASDTKSERTYRRAVEYLLKKRIIKVRDNILEVNVDYNLALLDLDNVKGIMIHIT